MTDLVASADPLHVAYGHNYLFEERVTAARQEGYESGLDLPAADLKSWMDGHVDYLYREICRAGSGARDFQSAQFRGSAEQS